MIKQIVFGTRGSPLAMYQTNRVIEKLRTLYPQILYKQKIIKTKGDIDQVSSLSYSEDLGLFYNEIQSDLIKNNIDIAVHSLKDVPVEYSQELSLVAIPERICAEDLLFHPGGLSLNALAAGSVIGTCSLRRRGQIKHLRKDIAIKEIRGNIQTRIEKVYSGEYDAIILASAGLKRLGHDISKYYIFNIDQITPAPGQGALAVEARRDNEELIEKISHIDNLNIRKAVEIERSILKYIGEGCSAPVGAFASTEDEGIKISACHVNPESGDKRVVRKENLQGKADEIAKLIADNLLNFSGRNCSSLYRE